MESSNTTCDFLAKILNGKGIFQNGNCIVTIDRNNISATIGNQPFHTLNHVIDFGTPDENGNSLITCELLLLESEVPNMVALLSKSGIIVSAVQSHWILDNPKLMYIYTISVTNRVDFANIMVRILNIITGSQV